MPTDVLVLLLVFAIPILGILLAGYKEWLKFRSKQRELGTSETELREQLETLQNRVDRLQTERSALTKRIQNLETIVTNEAWDALTDVQDAPASVDPSTSVDALNSTERAEKLADRLRS
jgi:uncharacterized protein YlxW (UPF0749 family)